MPIFREKKTKTASKDRRKALESISYDRRREFSKWQPKQARIGLGKQ